MMTVHEVSELKGVSPRTLRYYDQINLLPPTEYNEYGHRLYDDTALELLQQILLLQYCYTQDKVFEGNFRDIILPYVFLNQPFPRAAAIHS